MAPSAHGATHAPHPLQRSSSILTILRFMVFALATGRPPYEAWFSPLS
jgi:hypothetical protein